MAANDKTDPNASKPTTGECRTDGCAPGEQPGPVREAGGTTGAGNLSPSGASRTGGATSGVETNDVAEHAKKPTPPPSA